jgi:signal transduction histidine kinase
MIEEVSKQIRTISYLLHPPLLDEAGLASALNCYVEGFSKRSKINVKLEITPNVGRLPEQVEISVFRLIQECLTNIHRHSGSPVAGIHITRHEAYLTVEVEDAGKGMASDSQSIQVGVGIRGMQERLRSLGGSLQIHSNGRGTRLIAIIPLARTDSLTETQASSADAVLRGRSI